MRFRKDLGDLTELKKSISEVGLIHPIIISSTGELIAGERRLKACEELGIEPTYREVDFTYPERAQIEENTIRKDFTPEEIYQIGQYYNEKLSKQNQGRPKKDEISRSESDQHKQPRKVVADAVGKSTNTLSQINAIFESDDTQLKEKVNDGKISINKAYKKVKKEEKKKNQSEENEKIIINKENLDLRFGDFRIVLSDIPDDSIDLILTDPPYPGQFLPLYEDLGILAKRILKPNGFLISYAGHIHLPKVIENLSKSLDYYWCCALIHTGHNQLVVPRNMEAGWKPILIYQKGFKKIDTNFLDTIIGTGREKEYHEWQQAELELTPFIETFSSPGDIICDPFCGGGTTIVASYKLNRKVISCEIDKDTYNIVKKRINDI